MAALFSECHQGLELRQLGRRHEAVLVHRIRLIQELVGVLPSLKLFVLCQLLPQLPLLRVDATPNRDQYDDDGGDRDDYDCPEGERRGPWVAEAAWTARSAVARRVL